MGNSYGDYADYSVGKKPTYTFAKPDEAAASTGNPRAARNEYRKGLLGLSRAIVNPFDLDKDNKLSFSEFGTKEADTTLRYLLAQQGRDISMLTDSQKRQYLATLKTLQADDIKKGFGVLDINEDGFVDDKEIANEISLMDVNDKSGQNGTLDRSGHDRLYTKSPEILKKELKINYDTMNLKNLGEPGDIK